MFKVFGKEYYVDLNRFQELTAIPDDTELGKVDLVKFETIKAMIETILSLEAMEDEMLMGSTPLPIPSKLAFNTLIKYEILKEL